MEEIHRKNTIAKVKELLLTFAKNTCDGPKEREELLLGYIDLLLQTLDSYEDKTKRISRNLHNSRQSKRDLLRSYERMRVELNQYQSRAFKEYPLYLIDQKLEKILSKLG